MLPRMDELTLSHIWQEQWLRREALQTTDGRAVRIIYRGRWSHGLGPDFQDALLVFDDGPLLRGAIELHLTAADWRRHQHDHDPAYNTVILHLILDPPPAAAPPPRRADGERVAQLALRPYLLAPPEQFAGPPRPALGRLDVGLCAGRLLAGRPATLRAVIRQAGLLRIRQKATLHEAEAATSTPSEAFYGGLLEALGYSRNRQPFRELAARLPLSVLEASTEGLTFERCRLRLAAILLAAAGFWPWRDQAGLALAPTLIGRLADELEPDRRHLAAGPPPVWQLARVRPTNHPARRLLGLAALLARFGPGRLLEGSLALVEQVEAPRRLVAAFTVLRWDGEGGRLERLIGADRAHDIVINHVLPAALAQAGLTGDDQLAAAAERVLIALPAGPANDQTRAVLAQLDASGTIRPRGALEQQGLQAIFSQWCWSRRCFECPIAATAMTTPRRSGIGDRPAGPHRPLPGA